MILVQYDEKHVSVPAEVEFVVTFLNEGEVVKEYVRVKFEPGFHYRIEIEIPRVYPTVWQASNNPIQNFRKVA